MHACLQVLELITTICEHCCDLDKEQRPKLSTDWTKTLKSLSVTCRFFLEPALDNLWRESTPIRVFRQLPVDLWNMPPKRSLGFKRPVKYEDFQGRFMYYAKRVRTVVLEGEASSPIRSEVYSLLRSCPGILPLLPNIRSMRYHKKGDYSYTTPPGLLHTYLSPSLSSIEMIYTPEASLEELTLISHLHEWCPSLTGLSLRNQYWLGDPKPVSEAFSTAVVGWTRLDALYVPGITESALKYISTLPHLKSLELWNNRGMLICRDALGENRFPALEKLRISRSSAEYCSVFLAAVSGDRLTTIWLEINSVNDISGWNRLLSVFDDWKPDSELFKLRIEEFSYDGGNDPEDSFPTFGMEQIRHLIHLRNIWSVNLGARGQLDLDNSSLVELAKAWPELRTLVLGLPNRPNLPVKSKITLDGLACVAEQCINLFKLAFPFDATNITLAEESTRPPGRFSFGHDIRLGVHACPITSVNAVTLYLSRVFPKVKFIERDRRGQYNEEHSRKWDEVESKLPLLAAGRAQVTVS